MRQWADAYHEQQPNLPPKRAAFLGTENVQQAFSALLCFPKFCVPLEECICRYHWNLIYKHIKVDTY